jgi:dienelactone hydrolase
VGLLWPGRGPAARDVLAGLAARVAGGGAQVLVPDWRSDAADHGRSQLLSSLGYARGRSHDLVLAGWSRGAAAAAAVALLGDHDSWRPRAVVTLAGGFGAAHREPISGLGALDLLTRGGGEVPFHLLHGTADEVVPVARSRRMAAALAEHGRQVRFDELDTNHAGIVGAEYDPAISRCRPSDAPAVAAAVTRSAAAILHAAGVGVIEV